MSKAFAYAFSPARLARGTARPPRIARELVPGDRVDHYLVVARLGAGGMGEVYRVAHWTLGRSYALKVLSAEARARDPEGVTRFVREACAASRIRHPNIIDVFDFGYLADGRPYLVMELLAGESLAQLVDGGGALVPGDAVALARQLADALASAHDAGVIHADVSPANVLVCGGHVKLFDFGLAQLRETRVAASSADVPPAFVMGTPSYVSPEQLRGGRASEASDQYALGVLLYEMLAGRPPFASADLAEVCRQHVWEPAPPVRSPLADLPPLLVAIVARMLAKAPGERFAGLHEVSAELAALSGDLA